MITNASIEEDIRWLLYMDPDVVEPMAIAVCANAGRVTRGAVMSFAERRAALSDARRADGVHEVIDEPHVRRLDVHRREDAEIRSLALQRL